MTVTEVVAEAARRLASAGVPEPARDARRLVAHAMGIAAGRMTLVGPDPFDTNARQALDAAIERRCARQPVSQIVGTRAFWGREFLVTPDVLDPRPETETLIELALARPFRNVLDLGTGSGCILLTLMAERPGVRGTGTDMSAEALAVAVRNAEALGLAPTLMLADWFDGVTGAWDLIVSNPPYIAEAEMAGLSPELAWEPRGALTPGGDGLDAYRRIAERAVEHLLPGGRILLEIGPTQGAAVTGLLKDRGFSDVMIGPDLDGRDRVVLATMSTR